MSITVQNRFLRVRDCLGEGKASAILQDTLDLTGEYPDVDRVIVAHAVPRHVDAVCGEGRVMVRGAVDLRLLYEAAKPSRPRHEDRRDRRHDRRDHRHGRDEYDDQGHHDHDDDHDDDHDHDHEPPRLVLVQFKEVCSFEVAVEMSGVSPGFTARAMVTIESVNASLVNRRRLGCDVALVAVARVCEDQEVRAAVEGTALPPDRVRFVREVTHVEHLVAEAESPLRLEMNLAVPGEEPPLGEVLWVVPRCHHVMGRTGEGKCFVEGVFDVDAVYLTGDPQSPVRAFSWPDAHRFSTAFDLPGARPGMMLLADWELEDCFGLRETDRCCAVTVDGRLRVAARQAMDLPLVTDVVAESGGPLDVIRRTVRFPHHLPEGHRELTLGGVLSLPPTKPPVGCVLWTGAVFIPDQVAVEDGRVLVEGDLSLDLLYQAADPDCMIHHAEFPRALRLSQAVEIPGVSPGMSACAHVSLHTVACRLVDPETIQVDVVLKLHVRAMRVVQVEVVVECIMVAPCPPGTTLRLVVVQPGDTLWKLSRRYGVPLEAIIRANPQIPNPDLIYPGQRVRIPCAPIVPPADPA
ncbi:MAG: SafA/ExsA family spore coat assembly protein [Bacillota bacterium]|nr:SafA/ExsA family spore coat assembly protein [Bacillota bacterium]